MREAIPKPTTVVPVGPPDTERPMSEYQSRGLMNFPISFPSPTYTRPGHNSSPLGTIINGRASSGSISDPSPRRHRFAGIVHD